jgi:hypothetical protein
VGCVCVDSGVNKMFHAEYVWYTSLSHIHVTVFRDNKGKGNSAIYLAP